LEVWLLHPETFPEYAMNFHGFWLGMICFFTGFLFVSLGAVFWKALAGVRHGALAVALLLYLVRLLVFHLQGESNLLIAIESMAWMLAILGYGSIYLNKPSAALAYFSKAVYPVYIIHLPVQFALSLLILRQPLPVMVKLILLLAGTFCASLLLYEYVIRRLKWIRPLFGMKPSQG